MKSLLLLAHLDFLTMSAVTEAIKGYCGQFLLCSDDRPESRLDRPSSSGDHALFVTRC